MSKNRRRILVPLALVFLCLPSVPAQPPVTLQTQQGKPAIPNTTVDPAKPSAQGAQQRATMSLHKRGSTQAEKTETSETMPKRINPLTQTEAQPVIVVTQSIAESGQASNPSKAAPNQATGVKDQNVLSPECSWTLLLLNEVGQYYLISTGVPCLGCTIPNDLSQTAAGVLGFSHSPAGPWSETLTVYTTLDFSGNGTSELFYIKGQSSGASTFHGQNFWSSFNVDFQVVPCACPNIPIVP
jgi:hypothetical protein